MFLGNLFVFRTPLPQAQQPPKQPPHADGIQMQSLVVLPGYKKGNEREQYVTRHGVQRKQHGGLHQQR